MRVLYKNIAISSLVIALALITSTQSSQAQCTTVASCDSLGFNMDATKCDTAHPILKCPSDTSKAYCMEKQIHIGDIYYSDGTFSRDVITGKTPIGIIFDVTNKLVVALWTMQTQWNDGSTNYKDIPTLTNITSSSSAEKDMDGKGNTNKIMEFQSSSGQVHKAANACATYITKGTNKGDWFLPAAGQLKQLYDAKNHVNAGLEVLNIPVLNSGYYMSSSENSARDVWNIEFQSSGAPTLFSKSYDNSIYIANYLYFRPVMQF